MTDTAQTDAPQTLADGVTLGPGNGGLPRITIAVQGAMAEIYLNGATVTRYDVAGRPVLFCSRTSKFEPGKAIRGGVPIIFPWFGPHPTDPQIPQHGLVRAVDWTVAAAHRTAPDEASVVFSLDSSAVTRAVWPNHFELRYTVTVGARLELALQVTNRSAAAFSFEEALHTYLAISDVREVRITGLEQTEYLDKVDGLARKRQGMEPLKLTGETDGVFVNTKAACHLHDARHGDVVVRKEGSESTVVWNPWDAKAESLADLAGGQWPGMVCIETVNAMENAITLAPGASHTMKAIIEPQ